jgi:hypothetical protein
MIKKLLSVLAFSIFLMFLSVGTIFANSKNMGMHILHPEEVSKVREVYDDEDWRFVVIPLTLEDTQNWRRWQNFFDQAYLEKLIPIIRLSTRYNAVVDAWEIPNRKDIIDLANFLSSLDWHQDEKFVIIFNEVNHAKEWGGTIDPLLYSRVLRFSSNWFHSEGLNYKILPAAMDLAADNGFETMEAFAYLNSLYKNDPEVFSYIDYWNSHAYPNPGFQSSPEAIGQNSLSGFKYELNYLKNKTGKDFQVFITETGWVSTYRTNYFLDDYYLYALQHIWSDERVRTVAPFVLKGSPGPFSAFSFFDANDNPTVQTFALQKAMKAANGLDLEF